MTGLTWKGDALPVLQMRRVSLSQDSDPNPSVCRIAASTRVPRLCPGQRGETSVRVYVCEGVLTPACGAGRAHEGGWGWSVFVEQDCPAAGLPGSVPGGWRVNRLGGGSGGCWGWGVEPPYVVGVWGRTPVGAGGRQWG